MCKSCWLVKGYLNHEYTSIIVKALNKKHARKTVQKQYPIFIVTSVEEVMSDA